MSFLVNPWWYPPNVPVVIGSAMSAQTALGVTLEPNTYPLTAFGSQSASLLTLATQSEATGDLDMDAAVTLTFDAMDAPKALIVQSTITMTVEGAGTATGLLSGTVTGALTGTGAAVADAAASSSAAGALTLVGGMVVDNTLALLLFNGSDASTTITDEANGSAGWTVNGSGQLDTARQKFGSASLLAPTLNSGVDNFAGPGWTSPHAGDWTVEFFLQFDTVGGTTHTVLCELYSSAGADLVIQVAVDSDGNTVFSGQDSSDATIFSEVPTVSIAADTWFHIALVCDATAGTYAGYFNGARVMLASSGTDVDSFQFALLSLVDAAPSSIWVDELRVSKVARYSGATYIVPTETFAVD